MDIGHLNKKEGSKGLYRSLGSIDVVAAARSVLPVERDTENTGVALLKYFAGLNSNQNGQYCEIYGYFVPLLSFTGQKTGPFLLYQLGFCW